MKRAIYLLLGIVALLLGVVLIAGGATVASVFGSDDSISTAPARVDGTGVALVTENLRIDASSVTLPRGVGTLTLSVKAPDGRAMFAGTASPDDLDTYLTGAPYDVVVDLTSGSAARTRHVPGTQQPPPPAGQSFWVTQSEGTAPSISTALGPGDALVVLNADASPGVHADVVVTYSLAKAWAGAWTAVGMGVLLVLLSILAFWRARVAKRHRAAAKAAAAAAAATAVTAATAPGTVLPDAPLTAEPVAVPAWAATAPGSFEGDELSGPPTGSLVVDPSSDGTGVVVATTLAASEQTSAEPEAGWYPAAAEGEAVTPADDMAVDETVDETVDEEAVDDETVDEEAVDDETVDDETADDETADDETADEESVDEGPRDVATAAVVTDSTDSAGDDTAADDPMYEELSSWFRDDASHADDAGPAR